MNTTASRSVLALSCTLAVAGFLLPFWQLSLFGVALAVLSGRWIFGLLLGLLLDIAFGAPVGEWHVLYFPFVLCALVCVLVRYYLALYVRKSTALRL